MSIAIVIALAAVAASLYIRRITWHSPQEQAINLSITLQGVAAGLMLPWASRHIGQPLYELTGVANLDDLSAHICYITAGCMILLNSFDIHYEAQEVRRLFKQRAELPCTIVITLLVYTHLNGRGGRTQVDDFFNITSGPHLAAYWVILCATLIYTLTYATRLYYSIRDEPGFGWLVTGYTISAGFGILACITKIVVALLPVADCTATPYLRVFAAIFATGFATCSAVEWWRYQSVMSRRTGELAI